MSGATGGAALDETRGATGDASAPRASSRARRAWQRWADALCGEEDATPLALARIVACSTLCVHLVSTIASGGARLAWSHVDHGGLSVSSFAHAVGPQGVLAFAALVAAAAACGALGVLTRPSVLLAFLGLRVLTELTPIARGGYDRLLINELAILVVSGCGAALTITGARRGARAGRALRFARWLLVGQLALLYFSGGIHKLSLGWLPGGDASALWYALQQPMWARFAEPLPGWASVPLALATTSVWLFEVGAPLFLLAFILDERGSTRWLARALRRVHFRWLYLAFGFAMHVGIELSMEIGPFGWATLALYPCALPLSVWRRAPAPQGA